MTTQTELDFTLATRTPGQDTGTLHRFVVLFACQRRPNNPKYAHSFATFVEAGGGAGGLGGPRADTFTISWLPGSLVIRLFRPPEPGRNLGLHQTLDWARTLGARTTAWGPFEIQEALYRKARRRYEELESGALRFAALDVLHRRAEVTNCIHALSDLGLTPGLLRTGLAYGNSASVAIARHYRPWIVRPETTHPWVGGLLGLGRHPINFREPEPAGGRGAAPDPGRWDFLGSRAGAGGRAL